jgi:hypothetical protein
MQTDRMMYLALKVLADLVNPKTPEQVELVATARKVLEQFEIELGPLPEWASAHNISGEPVLFAQLYTLNGRQRGNGMIYHVGHSGKTFGIISDMGNTSTLNREELLSIYEIGDFILNEEGYQKRRRQNPDNDWHDGISEVP